MTRAEQLRLVADVVELLDERFPGKTESAHRENIQEARSVLDAQPVETLVESAQRVMKSLRGVAEALGLGGETNVYWPQAVRNVVSDLARTKEKLAAYGDEIDRLCGDLKKSELSREGVRQALGLHPRSTESTLDAVTRVTSELVRLSTAWSNSDSDLKKMSLSCEGEREFRIRAERERDDLRDRLAAHDSAAVPAPPSDLDSIRRILDARDNEDALSCAHRVVAELAALDVFKARLTETERVITETHEALQVPPNEHLQIVAERRMTSIRDLVAKADASDRKIAESLMGMFAGDDAPTAVKKLVEAHRRLTDENADLKRKIEGYGV
jgi:predicted SpoU family rRNA methylase